MDYLGLLGKTYTFVMYKVECRNIIFINSMAGSRPGGMIASAWTAIVSMGQNGYMNLARDVLSTSKKIISAVGRIKGIKLVSQPDMTCVAIMSNDPAINILAVADVMETFGWKMEYVT